jgi:hypothetical protein
MKKVVNGKLYDTEKAELVASWSFGNPGDFEYVNEELYVTKKGVWFLYGEGGAKSCYSKQIGSNTFSGSERIFPLTPEEAKQWMEEHDVPAETILKFFTIEDA